MPNIRFSKPHHSSSLRFWTWRDLNRKLQRAKEEDDAQAEQFAERAREVREEVIFLLGGGLSEGAEQSLNALAEEDMNDFCILVDLAEPVEIDGVEPLDDTTRENLHQFLDQEPWHSLAIDNDIIVVIACLDEVGSEPTNRPWYDTAPDLVPLLAKVLDRVNNEQLIRLVGEFNALVERDHLQLSNELTKILEELIHQASNRLGLPPQKLAIPHA